MNKHAKKLIQILVLPVLFFFSLNSATAMTHAEFEDAIIAAQKNCPSLKCADSNVRVSALSPAELKGLGKEKRTQMKELVVRLAEDIWGDTILEGPYENAGRYRIDIVEKVIINGQVEGFRMTYSDKAWNIETCNYDSEKKESLKDCLSGRIVESAFVDITLQKVYRDYESMATFVED